MDNWYNKQFTTNPDKNDKSLNATALAVLLLKDAPRYWHGHPSLEDLERRVPVVARTLRNTEGTFARMLRDLGFASTRPVVRNIRAPLDIIRPVPAKRPQWRPLCLSKEKVSGNVSLLNLLQFTRDLAQHTRPVVPVLCDENIHYRICKMMYGEKTTGWNVWLFLRSHPILYGFWHAYKFCVTQTFRSFWPIVTFFRKQNPHPTANRTQTQTPHNSRKPSAHSPGTEAARAMQVTRPNEIRSPGVRLHPKACAALGLEAERATPKRLGTLVPGTCMHALGTGYARKSGEPLGFRPKEGTCASTGAHPPGETSMSRWRRSALPA